MVAGRGKAYDVDAVAMLQPGTVVRDDTQKILAATVRVVVRFKRPHQGKTSYWADVQLGDGNPVTQLKKALVDLETETGLRFEMFEVVDVTRQFLAHAQAAGFRIKGFPVVAP